MKKKKLTFFTKFLQTFVWATALWGSIHLLLLFFIALSQSDIRVLGLFYVLDVHLLFPGIESSWEWYIGGVFVAFVVYVLIYLYIDRRYADHR